MHACLVGKDKGKVLVYSYTRYRA